MTVTLPVKVAGMVPSHGAFSGQGDDAQEGHGGRDHAEVYYCSDTAGRSHFFPSSTYSHHGAGTTFTPSQPFQSPGYTPPKATQNVR